MNSGTFRFPLPRLRCEESSPGSAYSASCFLSSIPFVTWRSVSFLSYFASGGNTTQHHSFPVPGPRIRAANTTSRLQYPSNRNIMRALRPLRYKEKPQVQHRARRARRAYSHRSQGLKGSRAALHSRSPSEALDTRAMPTISVGMKSSRNSKKIIGPYVNAVSVMVKGPSTNLRGEAISYRHSTSSCGPTIRCGGYLMSFYVFHRRPAADTAIPTSIAPKYSSGDPPPDRCQAHAIVDADT